MTGRMSICRLPRTNSTVAAVTVASEKNKALTTANQSPMSTSLAMLSDS